MTLDELRKLCLLHAFSISSCPKINEAFNQYESENKKVSDCDPDTNYVMKFEIEEIKKLITCLDNRIDNRGDSLDNKINLLEKEIETLKKHIEENKLSIIKLENKEEKSVSEPKQERFIFQSYDGSGKFHIYDEKQEHFHDGLFSKHQAEETCRILNSMEAEND